MSAYDSGLLFRNNWFSLLQNLREVTRYIWRLYVCIMFLNDWIKSVCWNFHKAMMHSLCRMAVAMIVWCLDIYQYIQYLSPLKLIPTCDEIYFMLRPVVSIKVFFDQIFLVKVFEGFLTVTTVKENFDQKL